MKTSTSTADASTSSDPARRYIPGVCNLGGAEVRMRAVAGWFCLGLTVAGWVACAYAGVPAIWRLLLALPATGALLCYLQAAMHFRVNYGLTGVFNVGEGVGKTDTVEQAEYRRMDQQKAFKIIVLAVVGGMAVELPHTCSDRGIHGIRRSRQNKWQKRIWRHAGLTLRGNAVTWDYASCLPRSQRHQSQLQDWQRQTL